MINSAMQQAFAQLEKERGLPAGYLTGSAGIESRYGASPDRPGSQFQGMFQLGRPIRQQYGVTDPSDWQQSARGAADYAVSNQKTLRNLLGRDPTASELYLAHQQGAGGAYKLLSNPGAPAGAVTKAQFIAANGGDPNAPSSDFTKLYDQKFQRFASGGGSDGQALAYADGQPSGPPQGGASSAISQAFGSPGGGASTANPSTSGTTGSDSSEAPTGWEAAGNIGNGLMGAGAALMAINNPTGAAAISSAMKANKEKGDEWSASIQNGQLVRYNKTTGAVESKPIPGFTPTEESTTDIRNFKYGLAHPDFKKSQEEADAVNPNLDDATVERLAMSKIKGGKIGGLELGSGKQGNANKKAIEEKVTSISKELGLKPEDVLAAQSDQRARNKIADQMGTLETNFANAHDKIKGSADRLRVALADYEKSSQAPIDVKMMRKLWNTGLDQISDPALARLKTSMDAFRTDYASALNPQKKSPTVYDLKHAEGVINEGMNGAAAGAVIDTVLGEVNALHSNYSKRHKQFFGSPSRLLGDPDAEQPAPAQAAPAAAAPAQAPQQAPASGGDIPTLSDPAEARKLKPGSQFRTPDGRLLRVPMR